jgi:hypothetical protein
VRLRARPARPLPFGQRPPLSEVITQSGKMRRRPHDGTWDAGGGRARETTLRVGGERESISELLEGNLHPSPDWAADAIVPGPWGECRWPIGWVAPRLGVLAEARALRRRASPLQSQTCREDGAADRGEQWASRPACCYVHTMLGQELPTSWGATCVMVLPRHRGAWERRGFVEPMRRDRERFATAALDRLASYQLRHLADAIFSAPASGRNLPRPEPHTERSAILAAVRNGTLGLTVLVRVRPASQGASSASEAPSPAPAAALPAPPAQPRESLDTHWVGVQLVDDNGRPLGQVQVAIEDAAGRPHLRFSDANGKARAEGVAAGPVTVRIPEPATAKR